VGTAFEELVINNPKDVLLYFYDDWCDMCKDSIEILSQVFANNNNIVIARTNDSSNWIDPKYASNKVLPNISLFLATNKNEPIRYKSNQYNVEKFIEFLHTHATIKFNVDAAKEKGQQLKIIRENKPPENVLPIHNAEDFRNQLNSERLVIVFYFTNRVGPCRAMAPVFGRLSSEFHSVLFLRIDVDEVKQDHQFDVPSFRAYKNGEEVGKVIGAWTKELRKLIEDNL